MWCCRSRLTPWDEAKDFCRRIAEQMAADSPDRYTATIKKTARSNRIFIDYLRNSREATAIAPYSTRARPGATVSAPLTWEELGAQKTSNAFTVAEPAEAARPPAPRSVGGHRPPQAEPAGSTTKRPGRAGPNSRRSSYGNSVLSTRSRSSLANGFCSTGRSR